MASTLRPDLNQDTVVDVTMAVDEIEELLNYVEKLQEIAGTVELVIKKPQVDWILGRLHSAANHTRNYPYEPFQGVDHTTVLNEVHDAQGQ